MTYQPNFPDNATKAICLDFGEDEDFLRYYWRENVNGGGRGAIEKWLSENEYFADIARSNDLVRVALDLADWDYVRWYLDDAAQEGISEYDARIEHERIEGAPGRFV